MRGSYYVKYPEKKIRGTTGGIPGYSMDRFTVDYFQKLPNGNRELPPES